MIDVEGYMSKNIGWRCGSGSMENNTTKEESGTMGFFLNKCAVRDALMRGVLVISLKQVWGKHFKWTWQALALVYSEEAPVR